MFTAIVKKIVEPGGKSSVKLSSSTATTKPLAIVSPSKESRGGAETVARWGRSKELEARSVRRADDGGGLGLLRRGSSVENVNKPPSPVPSDKLLAPNGNLKRLKTGKEQVHNADGILVILTIAKIILSGCGATFISEKFSSIHFSSNCGGHSQ